MTSKDFYEVNEEQASVSSSSTDLDDYQIRGLPPIDTKKLNLSSESRNAQFLFARKKNNIDLDSVATQPSVYDVPEKRQLFWPRADYENLHRFDVDLRWTWREEINLIRKIDYKILIWTCVMFFALEIDRANISQALSDNMLKNLKMTTNDYNNGMTIFYCSFLFAELPSQLISKRVGPDRWIPTQIVLWSIVAICQFFITGRSSFYVTRFLLGLLQGGFIPDVILYLSYFYTGKELPFRCSIFWTFMILADIASSFLGFGILHMRGKVTTVLGNGADLADGWRWLFLIEGLMSLLIGIFAFALMPAAPTATASWFRGKKGWFTPREESIMVTRVLRNDPTKGTMHNRQGLKPKEILKSVLEYDLWPVYLIGLSYGIPVSPVKSYLTLTLRGLGFGTFKTNLLTIPASVLQLIQLLVGTYISEYVQSRSLVALFAQIWLFPLLVAFQTFGEDTNKWVKFVVTTLIVGYFYPHAIQVAWCSRNSNTVRTRTVSASVYNISVQLSSIISSQIYRADDAPLYKKANKGLLAVNVYNIALYISVFFFYRYKNRIRDKIWKSMTPAEQEDYVQNGTDEGSKRLDFRFAY